MYPEDFNPPPLENLSAPPSRSNLQGNGVSFALQHAVAMNAVPVTTMYGNTAPLLPGAWQTPPEYAFMAHAWQVDSNVQTSLACPQWIPVSHDVSQYQMWQSTSTFGSEMPYRTQNLSPEIKTNDGLAVPLSLPDYQSAYNPFNSVDNALYNNRAGPAWMAMYQPFLPGSRETLVATSPADLLNPTQLPWNEATPALSQTSETDSTCSPNRDDVLSPGSSEGYGAYNVYNHLRPSKTPCQSFSVTSDETVTPSFGSGATPLALVASLFDNQSCLFSEIASSCVPTDDLGVPQEEDLQEAAVQPGVAPAYSHGKGETKLLAQKRTREEVRSEQPSTKPSLDFCSLSM